jgi:hypothetical protein
MVRFRTRNEKIIENVDSSQKRTLDADGSAQRRTHVFLLSGIKTAVYSDLASTGKHLRVASESRPKHRHAWRIGPSRGLASLEGVSPASGRVAGTFPSPSPLYLVTLQFEGVTVLSRAGDARAGQALG